MFRAARFPDEFDLLPAADDLDGWSKLRESDLDKLGQQAWPRHALLHYQGQAVRIINDHDVVFIEKSRRIGLTWGVANWSVTHAAKAKSAGGSNVLYIGYSLDMAREFIDAAGDFARALDHVISGYELFIFDDGSDEGIQAYRVRFASGFEIKALSSKPRSLRGQQGVVIIDEAAFHDDLEGLLKAAFALLMWGGKVIVISTHEGSENTFNEYITLNKEKRRNDAVIRITFDQALRDGLFMRICQVKGEPWSPRAEAEWRAKIYKTYGPGADEELRVIPERGGGRYFSRAMLEACADKTAPVLRYTPPEDFLTIGEEQRRKHCQDWIREELAPALKALHPSLRCALGNDFALTSDLSIFVPIQITERLGRKVPFTVEMRGVPYEQQKQIFNTLARDLPRLGRIFLDARGNGQILAQHATLTFGHLAEAIFLTRAWYGEHFPPLKARFEDQTVSIPADAETIDDMMIVKMFKGVPQIPDQRTQGAGGKRHGDFAVGLLLANAAADDMRSEIDAHGFGEIGVFDDVADFVGGF